MYAIIVTGGKQYKVAPGDILRVEKLEAEAGSDVAFEKVLMVADGDKFDVGAPYLSGRKVTATVMDQGRGKKVNIIKFRRRKHHMKRQGHRQYYTEVRITEIS